MQEKRMNIISAICAEESIGCRSLNKSDLVYTLMETFNMDTDAIVIHEIPVDWDDQVLAVFTYKGEWYEFSAGISADGSGKYFEEICKWSEDGNGELVPFSFFSNEKPEEVTGEQTGGNTMSNLLKYGVYADHFCGNKISEYGIKHNRVDYATLAKAFDAVLNNNILSSDFDAWEQVSGYVDNTEEIEALQEKLDDLQERADNAEQARREGIDTGYYDAILAEMQERVEALQEQIDELQEEMDYPPEVFQWYIVSNSGADILQEINEIVFYNYDLDMYLWGVTHYGTSWDHVLTAIPCNTGII